jgi:2-oxoglutarate dehydrogenase E1 component
MQTQSYISNTDPNYIDQLYNQYQHDKTSVDYGWQKFFEGFDLGTGKALQEGNLKVSDDMLKEINVLNLISAYRERGHLFTKTNPVRQRRTYTPTLDPKNYNLETSDLDKKFNAGHEIGIGNVPLKDIIQTLEDTYCDHIGVEYVYISDPERVAWLQERLETNKNQPQLSQEEKRHALHKLNQATVFENFLHTKYIGQKRFSLEGLECLIPCLDTVIEYGASKGVKHFFLGMAHRGRLNVLANIFNKTYTEIFKEFEGKVFQDSSFEGDVKYHLGYHREIKTDGNKNVKLTLSPNPSHLEAVGPVVKGIARANLATDYNDDTHQIAPILMHGDAAISGQGVLYELLQMSGLDAYNVGGCIHIVTNNQIGFTTNYQDGRTSIYCTDVAKITKCPVFHVNGDDVEAVIHVIKLAMDYRQKFNDDIFIDLLGYRKYGHNEGDEPRFTQPILYKAIKSHLNPREIYKNTLLERGDIDAEIAKEMELSFKKLLQDKLDEAKNDNNPSKAPKETGKWSKFVKPTHDKIAVKVKTNISAPKLTELAKKINTIPEDNLPIKKTQKIFEDRLKMVKEDRLDWAMGELLAYASLIDEGHSIRMSGQDCERGTFSHRHAVIKKEDSEKEYIPLANIKEQDQFQIYNSLLSEYAVLGFEYGYSTVDPNTMTIWEAQFGDFGNGAQIVIDQFISSAEAKWGKYSGLVMLLPHGYEGQGPEHSSARLERFLQLSANCNMQVMNVSTPANYFHALRRQLKMKNIRLPLVFMTPKSLLRHPQCVSTRTDFTQGGFQEIIDDSSAVAKTTKRVLMCSGKIYYDLLARKVELKDKKTAIVRIEQIYPLAESQLEKIEKKYKGAEFIWVQEEPKNMGAYTFLMRYELFNGIRCIARKSSASPATGFKKVHEFEQEAILEEAFKG